MPLFQLAPINSQRTRSHIVSGTSIPSHTLYSGNDQQFKLDVETPSLLEKDTELFYPLVAGLLFTSKIARPDIKACGAYIFARMELPMNYYKDRHVDIDILFVNKTQCFDVISEQNNYVFQDVAF